MSGNFMAPERAHEIYLALKRTGRLSCTEQERDLVLETWASLPRKATLCHALMVIAMPEARLLIEQVAAGESLPLSREDVGALLARQAF